MTRQGDTVIPTPRYPSDGGSAGTAGRGYRVPDHDHRPRQEHEPGRRPVCRECEQKVAR